MRPGFVPDVDYKHPWLYVSGYSNSVVCVYDLAKAGFPQIGTITYGVSSPAGVTVDKGGNP